MKIMKKQEFEKYLQETREKLVNSPMQHYRGCKNYDRVSHLSDMWLFGRITALPDTAFTTEQLTTLFDLINDFKDECCYEQEKRPQ